MATKKSPYETSNTPVQGDLSKWQTSKSLAKTKKEKDMEDLSSGANKADPIGDAVRDLWKKVKG